MLKRPSSEILLFLSRKRQCFYVLKKRIPVSAVLFFSAKIVHFQVLQALARAEKKLKPNWREMFTEVSDVLRKRCLLLDFVQITYQNVKLAIPFRCTMRFPQTFRSRCPTWRNTLRCTKISIL